MRDHELELIAALVEGRLDDETEARSLIASSPDHQKEYQAQMLAFAALSRSGTASLTESERSALHREVWTELSAAERTTGARTPWYYRWVPAAAVLVALIGVATIFYPRGQEAFMEIAADLGSGSATSTMAGAAMDGGEDDAFDGEGATTAAAAEAPSVHPSEQELAIYQEEAERWRQGAPNRSRPYESLDTGIESCVEQAGLSGNRVIATLDAPMEATDTPMEERHVAMTFPEGMELAGAPISFVDLDSCEILYTDR